MTDEKSHLPPYSPGLKSVLGAQAALSPTSSVGDTRSKGGLPWERR